MSPQSFRVLEKPKTLTISRSGGSLTSVLPVIRQERRVLQNLGGCIGDLALSQVWVFGAIRSLRCYLQLLTMPVIRVSAPTGRRCYAIDQTPERNLPVYRLWLCGSDNISGFTTNQRPWICADDSREERRRKASRKGMAWAPSSGRELCSEG